MIKIKQYSILLWDLSVCRGFTMQRDCEKNKRWRNNTNLYIYIENTNTQKSMWKCRMLLSAYVCFSAFFRCFCDCCKADERRSQNKNRNRMYREIERANEWKNNMVENWVRSLYHIHSVILALTRSLTHSLVRSSKP